MALLEATDCLELNAKYPRCSASRAHYIGDGECYEAFNTEACGVVWCGFDVGDCV